MLGDRSFSKPWGGSVLDSIIGTFLTQNVADQLSSQAYMTLLATFPAKPYLPQPDCPADSVTTGCVLSTDCNIPCEASSSTGMHDPSLKHSSLRGMKEGWDSSAVDWEAVRTAPAAKVTSELSAYEQNRRK